MIITTREIITPEVANLYLLSNVNNYRKVNKSRVAEYAADMREGRWEDNGESIKFSEDGFLVDGQHRLMAISRSGISIPINVSRGISRDVHTFDVGQERTRSQILSASGIAPAAANQHSVGAARIIVYGSFRSCSFGRRGENEFQTVTGALVGKYIQSHEDDLATSYRIAMTKCGQAGKTLSRKSPVIAAIYCLIRSSADPYSLRDFFEIVNSGFPIDGTESTPALSLRNLLLEHKGHGNREADRKLDFCATVKSFDDFTRRNIRRKSYGASSCLTIGISLLNRVREKDGIS